MTETIRLGRFSTLLGYEAFDAEAVGPKLVKATIWVNGRIVQALIADPDSMLGWAFLTNSDATWRAAGVAEGT